jgi:Fe-S-cluster containining protein
MKSSFMIKEDCAMRLSELRFTMSRKAKPIRIGRYVFLPPENISWSCQICGNCCKHIRVPVWEDEIKTIAEKTGKKPEEFVERGSSFTEYLLKSSNGTCIFQEGNKCTIHDFKPIACRLYPTQIVYIDDKNVYVGIIAEKDGDEYICHGFVNRPPQREDFEPFVPYLDAVIQKLTTMTNEFVLKHPSSVPFDITYLSNQRSLFLLRRHHDILEHVSKIFRQNEVESVLVLGFGHDLELDYFRREGFEVVGVDISPHAFFFLDSTLPAVCADAQNLPFADKQFDAVFSFNLLYCVDDDAKVISESLRVAKKIVCHVARWGNSFGRDHKRTISYNHLVSLGRNSKSVYEIYSLGRHYIFLLREVRYENQS